ncbi:MAG: response regulator [Armatimonadetes bacterium]|nr:response regulator [Armatimonadota bacterium]
MDNGLDILIVDDDTKLLDVLTTLLQMEGHRMTAYDTAQEALMLAKDKPFDLVITDLRMRRMDGLQLLKVAKLINPDLRVVIMTAYATVDTTVEAMRSGAYDYLRKPFKLNEIKAIIRRVQEEKREPRPRESS